MARCTPPRRRRARRWRVAAVAAVLTAACTTGDPAPPEPSPTPSATAEPTPEEDAGDRVAVVVAPSSDVAEAEAAALLAAGRSIAADPPDGVVELRVVRATDRQFAADLVALFVDDGFDVVCVAGSGAAALALEAARRHRATTICATDLAVEGGPANVVAVAVDPRALVTAAGAATATARAPVGLVVDPAVGSLDVLEPLLTSLLPEPPPPPPPSPAPTDADGADPAPTAGATTPVEPPPPPVAVVGASTVDGRDVAFEAVAASGAVTAVVLVPASGAEVTALGRGGVGSVVVADWAAGPDGALPAGVLVGLTVDRTRQLRAAIEAARTPGDGQVSLLRLGDGVLGAVAGTGAGAGDAVARVLAAVAAAADAEG